MSCEDANHPNCGICGGALVPVWHGYPGYQRPGRFDLFRCDTCGSNRAWPAEVPDGLYEAIYRQRAILPGYSRYEAYACAVARESDPLGWLGRQEAMYWAVEQFVRGGGVARSARVLDVGSGLGYLTHALVRDGWSASGVDLSAQAVAEAEARFGPHFRAADVRQLATETPESFGLVCLLEVIEHLTEPVELLGTLARLLAPGGTLLVSTPNRSVFPSSAPWHGDAPPVHLWWLSEGAMEHLAKRLGLRVRQMDFTAFNAAHPDQAPRPDSIAAGSRLPFLDRDGGYFPARIRSIPTRVGLRLGREWRRWLGREVRAGEFARPGRQWHQVALFTRPD